MSSTSPSRGSDPGYNAEPQRELRGHTFGQLFEAGQLTPVIDRTYAMEQAAVAHAYVDTERKVGSVILEMAGEGSAAAASA